MKFEKLFKKLESFFDMEKNEQEQNIDKKEKLTKLLSKKIDNKKQKIKLAIKKEKKEKLKNELRMLKKISTQYNM